MSSDLNGALLEHNSLLFGISMHEPAELTKKKKEMRLA
jgi:hypothetical protein